MVANALSHLPMHNAPPRPTPEVNLCSYFDAYAKEHEDFHAHPLSYKMLDNA